MLMPWLRTTAEDLSQTCRDHAEARDGGRNKELLLRLAEYYDHLANEGEDANGDRLPPEK